MRQSKKLHQGRKTKAHLMSTPEASARACLSPLTGWSAQATPFPSLSASPGLLLLHSKYLQGSAGALTPSPPEWQQQKPRHTVILGLVFSALSLEFSSKMYF